MAELRMPTLDWHFSGARFTMRSLKDLGFGKVIITIRTITPIILILILILALIAFMSTTVFKYFIIIPKKIDRVFCRLAIAIAPPTNQYCKVHSGWVFATVDWLFVGITLPKALPYGSVEGKRANKYTLERVCPQTEVRIHPYRVVNFTVPLQKFV